MCGTAEAALVAVIVLTTTPPGSQRTMSAYQVLGSALASCGSRNSRAKAALIAPAVLRRIAPSAKASKPDTVTKQAVSSTARSTPGCASVAVSCVLRSRYWPMKNEAKLVTSEITSITAVSTAAFAQNSTPRRGITESDVRIIPVAYSDVTAMAPSITMTSCPIRASPTTLDCVAAKLAWSSGAVCAQWAASPAQSATAHPTPASTSRIIVQ